MDCFLCQVESPDDEIRAALGSRARPLPGTELLITYNRNASRAVQEYIPCEVAQLCERLVLDDPLAAGRVYQQETFWSREIDRCPNQLMLAIGYRISRRR